MTNGRPQKKRIALKGKTMGVPLNEIFDNDSVFYSWQSDVEGKICKPFIRMALKTALKNLDLNFTIEEDMRGVAGTPILTNTLFSKIEKSYAFIADVSLCYQSNKRKFPNPNVMIELGYAAKALGWNRIIVLMNEITGMPSELPVDIRDRRHPIFYRLDAGDQEKESNLRKLSATLKTAITATIDELLASAEEAIRKLDGPSLFVLEYYLTNTNDNYPSPHIPVATLPKGKLDFSTFSLGSARLLDLGLIRTFSATTCKKIYLLSNKKRTFGFQNSWIYQMNPPIDVCWHFSKKRIENSRP